LGLTKNRSGIKGNPSTPQVKQGHHRNPCHDEDGELDPDGHHLGVGIGLREGLDGLGDILLDGGDPMLRPPS
jgi:hypothetical protein